MSINEARYKQLLKRDGTHESDVERKALFYVVGGNDGLYEKVESIYDFEEKAIKADCLDDNVDFSSSSKSLIKLAFNLFNGYSADVYDTFAVLDEENTELALNAIRLRFIK